MSTIRVGSNEKYASGWEKAFGASKSGPGKAAATKPAPKKSAKKKAAPKKVAKKK